MRLPHLRFTLRQMMVAVATVGLSLAAFRTGVVLGVVTVAVCGLACWSESEERFYRSILVIMILYCIVCSLTLPFVNALWLGEIPPLAIVQLPKIQLADWLRSGLVMRAIEALGYSRGSFSPDYIRARPYALAIAYLIPLGLVIVPTWLRTHLARPFRKLILRLLFVAAIDYGVTLFFGSQRFITRY